MTTETIKGQMPDQAIADMLQLAQRPEFKKLLYVPTINWVLGLSLLAGMALSAYVGHQWFVGELHYAWAFVVIGYTFFISLLVTHDACHLAMGRSKFANDWLASALVFPFYPHQPIAQWRHQHLSHHRDTCGEEDPDHDLYNGNALVRIFKLFTHDLYWTHWSLKNRDSAPASTYWINIASLTLFAVIVVAGLSSAYWYEFLLLYLIPQRIVHGLVIYILAYMQHPPEKCDVKEVNPFKTTIVLRGFTQFYYKFLFSQNRHLIHHLYPNMPIYRNGKAWEIGKDIFEKQELVNVGINADYYNEISAENSRSKQREQQYMQAEIESVTEVADGIKSYVFVPASNGIDFPKFKAGAHIDVVVAPGLVRQYSLCNSPEDENCYRIAVQCEPDGRGGSQRLHDSFAPGQSVQIGKPRNLFELQDTPEAMLFAGGIGITPMLAMAWALHRQGTPFELHYCTATQGKWAFKDQWRDLPFVDNLHVYLDDDNSTTFNAEELLQGHEQASVYTCGPGGYMDYIERSVQASDVPDGQFHKESFVASSQQDAEKNKPFVVKLSQSGQEFAVPADKSIVQVLNEAQVFIPVSCENGVCGTCKCKVDAGEVDHRDMVLTDGEREQEQLFTPCVSRAKGAVLEISGF